MRFEEGAAARTCVYRFLHRSSSQGFFSARFIQCRASASSPQSRQISRTLNCNLSRYALSKSCDTNRSSSNATKSGSAWSSVGESSQSQSGRSFSAVWALVFRDGSAMSRSRRHISIPFSESLVNTSSRTRSQDNSSKSSAVSCGTSSGYSTKRISRQMSS